MKKESWNIRRLVYKSFYHRSSEPGYYILHCRILKTKYEIRNTKFTIRIVVAIPIRKEICQAVSSFFKLQQQQKSKLKFLKDGMDNRIQKKLGLAHIKRYFIKSIQLDKVCPYKSCLVIQQM